MNDLGRMSAYIALFSEIGFVLLITVLAGVLGGYWLDQQLGTVPDLRTGRVRDRHRRRRDRAAGG